MIPEGRHNARDRYLRARWGNRFKMMILEGFLSRVFTARSRTAISSMHLISEQARYSDHYQYRETHQVRNRRKTREVAFSPCLLPASVPRIAIPKASRHRALGVVDGILGPAEEDSVLHRSHVDLVRLHNLDTPTARVHSRSGTGVQH